MGAVLFRSANGFTLADADDPQSGQRSRGHLDAHALAGPQHAQSAGVENVAFKRDLTAIVKEHTACAALIVVPVHTGLHVISLVIGSRAASGVVQHGRGVRSDPDRQGFAQRLVVIHISA